MKALESPGMTVAVVFSLAEMRPAALVRAPVSMIRRPVAIAGAPRPDHGPGALYRATGSNPRCTSGRASVQE